MLRSVFRQKNDEVKENELVGTYKSVDNISMDLEDMGWDGTG
jgi:hypothetical protein